MMNRSFPKVKKQYIKLEEHDNFYVIPYVRGRLVFAELAARALEKGDFEQVIVDLPYFLGKGDMWEKPVSLFPHVSSLVIKKDDGFIKLPFSPSDAACMTLAGVCELRKWGSEFDLRFIDDSKVIHYPKESLVQPELSVREDYSVFTHGLMDYFDGINHQLEKTWKDLSDVQTMFSEYRASIVSERLKSWLKSGKKTLFVCEYRLWWMARKNLVTGKKTSEFYFHQPWKDVKAALLLEEPLLMWSKGLLDDYPSLVQELYEKFSEGKINSFDKLEGLIKLIRDKIRPGGINRSENLSIRKILAFHRYLAGRTAGDMQYVPLPFSHLYEAALSCLGKKIADNMARRFLAYPSVDERRIREYFKIHKDRIISLDEAFSLPVLNNYMFFSTTSDRYSFDNVYDGYYTPEDRVSIAYKLHPDADKNLKKILGRSDGSSWSIRSDFYMYEVASRQAREMLFRQMRQKRIRKSWGTLGEGIHWKSTISSRASGQDLIYVKYKSRRMKDNREKLNEFTPVVYIFTDNFRGHWGRFIQTSNLTGRRIDLYEESINATENVDAPDSLNHIYYTLSRNASCCNNHIDKRHVSSIAFLLNRAIMDVPRYEILNKRPKQCQCRLAPGDDDEVSKFNLSEKGIAWAIKYAEHTVIVVSRDGWNPSAKLAQFARRRHIRIDTVSLSNYKPEFIERLRTMHFTSKQLKRHPRMHEIVERYIN